LGQNRVSLEGRKIPGGVAQPGDRQEILSKLSILFVALLSLYSPKCVEGKFRELRLLGQPVEKPLYASSGSLSKARKPTIAVFWR
jgi:hypothetical protein